MYFFGLINLLFTNFYVYSSVVQKQYHISISAVDAGQAFENYFSPQLQPAFFSLSFAPLLYRYFLFPPLLSLRPLRRPSPSVVWVRQAACMSPDLPNSLQTPCCKQSDKELCPFAFTPTNSSTAERGREGVQGKEKGEWLRERRAERGIQSAFPLKGTRPSFTCKACSNSLHLNEFEQDWLCFCSSSCVLVCVCALKLSALFRYLC